MNRRGIIFALVVSMGLAWMAFALVKGGGGGWFGAKAPEGPSVLVANIDIPQRQVLSPEMFVSQVVPAGMYAQMMITQLDPAVRYFARKAMTRGEILYQSSIGNVTEEPELSYMIDRTQGVISISITSVAGVSGLIKPGDYVDVFATYSIKYKADGGGEKSEPNTKRIVTGCRVVSIAGVVLPPTKTPDVAGNFSRQRAEAEVSRVALAVSDTDIEKIIYAHQHGKIHLALKSDDKSTGSHPVYDDDDLQADLFNVVECIRAEDYRLLRVDR